MISVQHKNKRIANPLTPANIPRHPEQIFCEGSLEIIDG